MRSMSINFRLGVLLCVLPVLNALGQDPAAPSSSAGFIGSNQSQTSTPDAAVSAAIGSSLKSTGSHGGPGYVVSLNTPQGSVLANVGAYLPHAVLAELIAGAPVTVIGPSQTVQGTTYITVRLLVINGQTTTVRNAHGSPVRSRAQNRTHVKDFAQQTGGSL